MGTDSNTRSDSALQGPLKPCPFCGFDSQCMTTVTTGAGMFDALQCQHCGATGPYNISPVVPGDKSARWNARHHNGPTWTEENEPARILKNALFALERQKAPETVYGGVLTDEGQLAWVSYQLLPKGQRQVFKCEHCGRLRMRKI